jgi:hypothetical protein
MTNRFSYFINTRREPGVRNRVKRDSFQRLSYWGETVERVFVFFMRPHQAEAPLLMRARYLRLGNL